MKKIRDFEGKQILVLGLAKSGLAAAKLLHDLGATVVVNDMKPYDQNPEAKELNKIGIEVVCGEHPLELFNRKFELVVKNPGIPYTNQMVEEAKRRNILIITEVELAYLISEAEIVGITGSNGKTTTTTLVYEMLSTNVDTLLAGNIGHVACDVARNTEVNQWMVMELSSFQLMGINKFQPKISILLNLFDAHLDYHGTKEEYGMAKANLFKNQNPYDYSILNADDEYVVKLSKHTNAKIIWFSVNKELQDGASLKDGHICMNDEKIININEVVLPGKHNLENVLAAVAAAKIIGISNENIQKVLKSFTGVKHRLQYVTSIGNRKFYNDSKATNILATEKAVTAFEEPVILLAGGLDRGNSFEALVPALKNVKAVITFGQTSKKIEEAAKLAGIKEIKHVDNVEKAVPAAFTISSPGDVVLLSPACASWDQYKTFEERGDIFIEAVHKL